MVVAQLVEQSDVRIQSSASFYIERLFSVNCIEKTKIKNSLDWSHTSDFLGGSHGLVVVIGEDSESRDREFESQSRIRQSYKRYTIVKYDSRVVLTKNPPIVNYDR